MKQVDNFGPEAHFMDDWKWHPKPRQVDFILDLDYAARLRRGEFWPVCPVCHETLPEDPTCNCDCDPEYVEDPELSFDIPYSEEAQKHFDRFNESMTRIVAGLDPGFESPQVVFRDVLTGEMLLEEAENEEDDIQLLFSL